VRRERAGATKLRKAIDANKDLLDQVALKSLARLTANPDAAEVFGRLKFKNPCDGILIVFAYVEADKLFREFQQRITQAKVTLYRLDQLRDSLAKLGEFVGELEKRCRVDSLFAAVERKRVAEMQRGLKLIAKKIESKRCSVKEVKPQLGITRKTQSKEAAANAAIWLLAAAVRRITGKDHVSVVADLAQVLTGTDVSLDRVKHVVRYRRHGHENAVDAQTRRLTPVFYEMMAELDQHRLRKRQKSGAFTTEKNA
jgi:hypothetical protein